MAIGIDVEIDDAATMVIAMKLRTFGVGVVRGALLELGETVRNMAIDSFAGEKTPEGIAWKRSQRAWIDGGLTLTDSAVLKNSIGVNVEGVDAVTVGSNMVYAAIHQLGGDAGRNHSVHLPARSYLPEENNPELAEEAFAILAEHLERAMQ